jgi:hypothetical protein
MQTHVLLGLRTLDWFLRHVKHGLARLTVEKRYATRTKWLIGGSRARHDRPFTRKG